VVPIKLAALRGADVLLGSNRCH